MSPAAVFLMFGIAPYLPSGIPYGIEAVSQSPEKLTVEQAVKLAEERAYALKVAAAASRKAKAQYEEAKGNQGVQVRFGGSYTRYDREITSSFGSTTSVVRPIDQSAAQLILSYPIDWSGALGKVVRSAWYAYLATEDSFQAELLALKRDVRTSYFSVLQAQRQIDVFTDSLKVAKERLKTLESQLKQGVIARVDYLRGETQVRQAESDLISAKNTLELAKSSLNLLLSRPVDTEFTVEEVETLPDLSKSEAELIEAAKTNRHELKSLRNQAEVYASLTAAAKAAKVPTLNFSINHSKDFNPQGFSASSQTTFGQLSISFPIFDSGVTNARIKQAKEDEEQLRWRYKQVELGVTLEVRQALVNLENARARLEVAEKAVVTASENLRLAILRTDQGEGINLEVFDAQNQLTIARVQQVRAKYDWLVAHAQLQGAVGSDGLQVEQRGANR